MVLIECLLVLIATETLFGILLRKLFLLKLQVRHFILYLGLTELLLQPSDQFLESVLLPLRALEYSYVGFEPLVNLLSCGQFRPQLRHLLQLLLIFLDRAFMPLKHVDLICGLLELSLELFDALVLLSFDFLKLCLNLFYPFIFLAEFVFKLHLVCIYLLVHQ